MSNPNEILLDRIVNHLILNYFFLPETGLFHGKMGGVLFFKHYAKFSGQEYFCQYADDLWGDLLDSLSSDSSINFRDGLCGIGWGIEYIIQNKLAEGNSNKILGNIDIRIMEQDPRRMTDLNFETGLGGILYYVITRIKSFERDNNLYPFDATYLHDLYFALNNVSFSAMDNVPDSLVSEYNLFMEKQIVNFSEKISLPNLLFGDQLVKIDNIHKVPIGIYNGLTGMSLKMIL